MIILHEMPLTRVSFDLPKFVSALLVKISVWPINSSHPSIISSLVHEMPFTRLSFDIPKFVSALLAKTLVQPIDLSTG